MSFEQLDNFIESCAEELQHYQDTFQNQANEIQKRYMACTKNYEKLETINSRLTVLQSISSQIEREVENANVFINELERRVEHYDHYIKPLCGNPSNQYREELYGGAGKINSFLHNCNDQIELLQNSRNTSLVKCQDPQVESIAKIMMKLLQDLEAVEENLQKMKNYISCINWKHQAVRKI